MKGMLLRCMSVMIAALLLGACTRSPEIVQNCADIAAGCRINGLHISASQPPQILKPFELRMEIENPALAGLEEVHASFGMEGMEMGLNRYRLIKNPDGIWLAQVNLPACVRGRADWTLLLELEGGVRSQRYLVGFQTNS